MNELGNTPDGSQGFGVTVVIPTYCREEVLLDTLSSLFRQTLPADEILVVDQTRDHEPATAEYLRKWAQDEQIRWVRREHPSTTAAMNSGLLEAKSPLVLFLDDDVIPSSGLVYEHVQAYLGSSIWAVVGQVLQPNEVPLDRLPTSRAAGLNADLDFAFNSTRQTFVRNCLGGNLSVRRDKAIELGGFDENFCLTVAYRFETDFARRVWQHGGKVLFQPSASLRHLRASRGGTRSRASHLRSHLPDHSIGDYYFALVQGKQTEALSYIARRLLRSVTTRYHLRHPWWIVPRLIGEVRGLIGAIRLVRQGRRLLSRRDIDAALRTGPRN